MLKNRLITWAVFIAAFIAWDFLSRPIIAWVYLSLSQLGLPIFIIQEILFILALEIVVKFFVWSVHASSPAKFVPTEIESWQHLDREKLARYTAELEQLGFIQLTDFTLQSTQMVVRLFVHPQKFCFAEVIHARGSSMLCSLVCYLEQHWSLTTIKRLFPPTFTSAISYAFLQEPRTLLKEVRNTPVSLLFQSLLDWREQASKDLGVEPIQDIRAEVFFERERSERRKKIRYMLSQSMTWMTLKMVWFLLRPRSEWLGDYAKFKAKRR